MRFTSLSGLHEAVDATLSGKSGTNAPGRCPEEETGKGQPPDDEHSKEEGIQPPEGQSTLF